MFSTFFKFELNFWLRAMMVYVFTFIIGLLIFGAVSSENVSIGTSGSAENTFRNAPHAIQIFYAVMGIFTILMTTAFVNGAASRDFAHETNQLIYTKPIEKFGFLMGRFWGSTLVAVLPLLGISVGIVLAQFMPWIEPEFWGPICWQAHFWAIVLFAIPNTILVAAIIFAIAIWTRSTIASFVGALLLLVGYSVASSFTSDLDNERLGRMVDPFGVEAFDSITKYWTAAERNTQWLTLSGDMLWNRLIWLGVSMAVLALAYWRFSFTERMRRGRLQVEEPTAASLVSVPTASYHHGFGANLAQLFSQVRIDFAGIVKSNVFIVVALAFLLQISVNLYFLASQGFGLSALPVTYNVIGIIRASSFIFLIGTIVFYAGTLVWRERESQLDEVYDASPQPTWISYTGKLISLIMLILMVQGVGMLAGLISQAAQGFTRFQIGQYLTELFVVDFVSLFCLGVLAMFAHIISPNKYFGYFFFIFLVVLNLFGWNMAEIETRMVRYGSIPGHTYSDMYGFAPFVPAMRGFYVYWMLFTGIISSLAVLLWQRGKERGFVSRLKVAWSRWTGAAQLVSIAALIAWSASAIWVYYNVKIVNEFTTSESITELQADYEKQFKEKHEGVAQPRTTKIKYDIDIYPERRALTLHGLQTIENKSDAPIDTIYVSLNDTYENELTIGEDNRATIVEEYDEFDYYVYKLDPPLKVGESMPMEFTVSYEPKGFENTVANTSVLQNGTFFNNMIVPQLGYQSGFELSSKKERKERELEPQQTMPLLAPDDLAARANTYLDENSDWLEVETTISTSADQIAIAPGSLQKSWEVDGRRFFHYKVDHPSLNFYSFISARYAVEVRKWNGIDIEVYYHPEHKWNVANMLESIKRSLEYYTENFGPYMHKQARIIEFPRVASFAQAFPGTMPYSEGIGFIADIKEEDDIDMVFYVVAHEMAHQWWAHQVIGANMQGATLLSETLAQYSALMVMEKQYGRDIMRKFLQYELDNYLSSRGGEGLKEQPLKTVEAGQGYIHYRKGSCVMYYLKEMIGEEKVNQALRNVIEKFAYQPPPYPTSVDLIEALKEETPSEYQYLFNDLFENITLFANRTISATYSEREDGKYDVTIEVECKKFQAGEKGAETEIAINDWIEIGAFAKPEKGKKYGETLHRERLQITENENTFTFTVDSIPEKAGIDPFALLIDRMPSDNLKKVKVGKAS